MQDPLRPSPPAPVRRRWSLCQGLACATALSLAAACASPGPATGPGDGELAVSATEDVRAFDGRTGEPLTAAGLVARMRTADVVLFGELHGHPVGLPFFAEAFEHAVQHEPAAALALEFLTRDVQHVVDAYLADLIDWDGLVEAMAGSAGSSPESHRPMVEAAKAAGLPVLAANSPRTYTRAASRLGYGELAGLSASQRRLFDLPAVMPSGAYEQGFYDLMGGHMGGAADGAAPSEAIRNSFRAQALWDGTMAATVAEALERGNSPTFLVVGQYHCDNEGGTVQVLRHLRPDAELLVVSVAPTWSDVLLDEDRGRADCIVYVGPFED